MCIVADLGRLIQVWPYLGANRKSVSELFMEFMIYYSDTFNFEENVVCTRQLKPLTRLEKMWTGKKIAIEDPFLLTHNLGQGVDSQMATFIKACFRLGRNHFCSPAPTDAYCDIESYYFDVSKLTRGTLPTGRGCRICGKIGHKVKECEQRRQNKQKRSQAFKRTCNNCGSPDHLYRDCPAVAMQRNMRFVDHRQQADFVNGRSYMRHDMYRGRGGGGGGGTGMEFASNVQQQRQRARNGPMDHRDKLQFGMQRQSGAGVSNGYQRPEQNLASDMFPPLGNHGDRDRNQQRGSPRKVFSRRSPWNSRPQQ